MMARHAAVATVNVTIVRGSNATSDVPAVPGKTDYEEETKGGGITVKRQSRDFLIDVADYTVAGVAVAPQRGDQIKETVKGQVWVYELLPHLGEQGWRFSDLNRTRYRVHTKRVRIE